jgi:signal transduction histidine kinase/CheY-like chemotaxis protein
MTASDDFLFLSDEGDPAVTGTLRKWKVAIIDDDPAVHDGTRFALDGFVLNGHQLELLSAHSAREGRELLRAHGDIAVVLLDVVMETDSAGLDLVSFIRTELKNEIIRIILRTGQPGQAPERQVIVDYDINDYKAKTELTADKLFTALAAALRSYEQLLRMAETRRGLEIIVEAAPSLFDLHSMQRLAEGVLTQIASLLATDCAGILVLREGEGDLGKFFVLAASGCYRNLHGTATNELQDDVRQLIQQAFVRRRTEFRPDRSVLYIPTGTGSEVVVLLDASKPLSETDRALVEIFCSRLPTAFDNIVLYEKLQEANTMLERRVAARTAELTTMNQRLEAQWARARRTNALRSEVLGTVAHDLKNPLGIILGRTEILGDLIDRAAPAAEPLKSQVHHIRESTHRLIAMVDALLSDAMAETLDITIQHEHFDICRLIAEVVEANRPLAQKKQQSLVTRALAPIVVHGDYDRMREAIDNVISNAVKYSRIGGEIEIGVEKQEERVNVRVRDSGPGLRPEDFSRLFGRFQRLSAKPTGGENSTGLGLSIAKRILDLHGGTIETETPDNGQGTVFVLGLPDVVAKAAT